MIRGMDASALARPLIEHRQAIEALCREYGVERLEVFGSAADGRFDPECSDLDFIVRLARDAAPDKGSLGRRFVGLAEALERVLGRPVDLMSDQPIANPYLRRAGDGSRRLLYGRAPAHASA